MRVPRLTEKKYSVDRMMRNVALSLVRDFRRNLDDVSFCSDFERALRLESIADARGSSPTPTEEMDAAYFKATYQIQSVMKRYRFRKDIYSDDELTAKAISSFREVQTHLASQDLSTVSATTDRVLNIAAGYIAKTLGEYSDETHRNLCRFGKKASVGIPARLACEAARWELPVSGSREQILWFDSEMSLIPSVQDYWTAQKEMDPSRSTYRETSSLALTLVPKTFKALRSIMPNTTIGSYQSYGLGEMIRKCLKRRGYNIKTLQLRHRYLARKASLDNSLVTADLSSASDTISVALVQRLLPKDWFEVMNTSRIGLVVLPDGSECESLTFATMGIGYTFPLQTLVFLSLLKAIEHVVYHKRGKRTISVYGDDLIYPSAMHATVLAVFEEVGFRINVEKTFADSGFRESCGGDYYHGVDVRPFQPRNDQATVGPKAYEAVLYKYVNSLLTRWSEYEIESTLDYLTSEITYVTGCCKLVPKDYPEYSGIRCAFPSLDDFMRRTVVSKPVSVGHGVFRFSYIGTKSELREEKRHEPYYWLGLRGGPAQSSYDGSGIHWSYRQQLRRLIDDNCGCREGASQLIQREVKLIRPVRRSDGRRQVRRIADCVMISHTVRYERRSGASCFGPRS